MTPTEPPAETLNTSSPVVPEDDPVPAYWRPTVVGTTVAVALVHLIFMWGNRGPVLYQDALGYLGNARFLAGGTPPHFDGTGYYNAGYSLLLVPIYWVTQQSGIVWAAAVLLNVCLAVLILAPAYFLARRLFALPRRPALLAAVATSLTPALLLQPGRIWVETLFPVVFLTAAVLVYMMFDTKRGIFAFAAGLASGYLILIHGRGFAALGALILILAIGSFMRQISLRLVALALAGVAVGIAADQILHSYLRSHLWVGVSPANGNPVMSVLESFAPQHIQETLVTALGHLWYAIAASFGLVIVGVVALLIVAYRSSRSDSNRTDGLVSSFLVLSVAGGWLLSATFLSGAVRLDAQVYGRYLEGFTPALILAAAAWIVAQRKAWRTVAAAALSIPVTGLLLLGVTEPEAMTGNAIKLTIPGLLGLQTIVSGAGGVWVKHLDVLAISLLAGFFGLLVALASRRRSIAGLVAIVLLTVPLTFTGKVTSWDPFVSFFFDEFNDVPTALRELPDYDPVPYDLTFFLVDARNLYEFRLAPRRLVFVDDICDVPPGEFVISTFDPGLIPDGFTEIAADGVPKQALWFVEDWAVESCLQAAESSGA